MPTCSQAQLTTLPLRSCFQRLIRPRPLQGARYTWRSELLIGDQAVFGPLKPIVPSMPTPSTVPEAGCPTEPQILAVACSTNEPLHRILPWIRYHQLIGFSLFYFFVEGTAKDPAVVDVLRSLVGVKVRPAHRSTVWQTTPAHGTGSDQIVGRPGPLFAGRQTDQIPSL